MAFKRKRKSITRGKRFKRGGGGFKRKFKRTVKRGKRNTIFIPKNMPAPKQAFIKLRTVHNWLVTNPTGAVFDQVIIGNTFNSACRKVNNFNDRIGGPLYYYANLYQRYFIWKTKIHCKWFQTATPTADIDQVVVMGIFPSLFDTPYQDAGINWDENSNAPAPEEEPRVHYKYARSIVGNAQNTITVKHSMKTKSMMTKDVSENDYAGNLVTVLQGASQVRTVQATDPVKMWYYHNFFANVKGITDAGAISGRLITTITQYARLYQPITYERSAANPVQGSPADVENPEPPILLEEG